MRLMTPKSTKTRTTPRTTVEFIIEAYVMAPCMKSCSMSIEKPEANLLSEPPTSEVSRDFKKAMEKKSWTAPTTALYVIMNLRKRGLFIYYSLGEPAVLPVRP